MLAVNAQFADEIITADIGPRPGLLEFEALEFSKIPAQHPVALFAERYEALVEGMKIPDERDLLSDPTLSLVAPWLLHVEPTMRGVYVDFRITDGEHPFASGEESADGLWMDEVFDEDFHAPRYHEAVAASTLRVPMFSRGTVPSPMRSRVLQYRGVFPMFAENRARLRLAIVAAETFIEIGTS